MDETRQDALTPDALTVLEAQERALAFPDGFGARVATVAVSGLHEGRDHELAVRALAQARGLAYGTDVPAYTYPAR